MQHDSHTDMDRAALCGAGMLEKCFFAAYGLAQEKHRKISFVSCLRSRYRARERKRERRKASRISGYVQALCRSCLSFYAQTISKDDRLRKIEKWKMHSKRTPRRRERFVMEGQRLGRHRPTIKSLLRKLKVNNEKLSCHSLKSW